MRWIALGLIVGWNAAAQGLDIGAKRIEAQTVRGPIAVASRRFDDPPYVKVWLNDELIFSTSDFDWGSIDDGAMPDLDNAELLLLATWSGNQCAPFFRVIDLRGDEVKVSNEFGNCRELVEPTDAWAAGIEENPTFVDGEWWIATNETDTEGKLFPKWYVYRDGQVYEAEGERRIPLKSGEAYRYEQKLAMEIQDAKRREALIRQYGSAKAAYFAHLDEQAHEKIGDAFEKYNLKGKGDGGIKK